MPDTVTIPEKEYVELKKKAEEFDSLIDKAGLSDKELRDMLAAKKEEGISEEDLLAKHPDLSE